MSLLPAFWQRKTPSNLEEVFDLFFDQMNGGLVRMRVDVRETPTDYVIEADLPGYSKEEINVSLSERGLTITAEHKEEREEKKDTDYVIRERQYHSRSIERTLPLASQCSPENVKAEFKGGVLSVTVKKAPEKQSKKITVQ